MQVNINACNLFKAGFDGLSDALVDVTVDGPTVLDITEMNLNLHVLQSFHRGWQGWIPRF